MKIILNENDFGGYYYDFQLTVNGETRKFKEREFLLSFEEEFAEEELEVKIRFRNRFLSKENKERHADRIIDFLERCSCDGVPRSGEQRMCKPYDAVLEFTCRNTDRIELYTNSFMEEQPFTFYSRGVAVKKNLFYAEEGYKREWLIFGIGYRLIGCQLLNVGFLLLFLHLDPAERILCGLFGLMFFLYSVGFTGYVVKLLYRH